MLWCNRLHISILIKGSNTKSSSFAAINDCFNAHELENYLQKVEKHHINIGCMSSKEISINFLKKSNTMQASFKKHKKGGYLGLIGIHRPIITRWIKMFKRQIRDLVRNLKESKSMLREAQEVTDMETHAIWHQEMISELREMKLIWGCQRKDWNRNYSSAILTESSCCPSISSQAVQLAKFGQDWYHLGRTLQLFLARTFFSQNFCCRCRLVYSLIFLFFQQHETIKFLFFYLSLSHVRKI